MKRRSFDEASTRQPSGSGQASPRFRGQTALGRGVAPL